MTRTLVLLLAAVELCAQRTAYRPAPLDDRIAGLERRLKAAPGEPATLVELAGAFLQKMRETTDGAYLDRAARLVEEALRHEPAGPAARLRLAEIEMHRHHFRRVAGLARELSTERPENAAAWGLLGDALMELGEYDQAADAYQQMVDRRPSLASYSRVAYYRFVTGDARSAVEAMRMAIRAGSPEAENVAWCLAELGTMLFKTGAGEEAEKAFRDALARFPGYHPALAGLGRLEASRGRFERAVEHLRDAQARAPFPEYAGLLAKLYRKSGNEAAAKKQLDLLDLADRLDRAAGEKANRNLALAYADLGYRTSRAVELAKAEFEVRRDVYTWDALAWTLYRDGRPEAAAEAMEKALAQKTPEPAFFEHAAMIYEALGRREAAAEARRRSASF
jgi:tetratricopeptide (TPR) repeat protein